MLSERKPFRYHQCHVIALAIISTLCLTERWCVAGAAVPCEHTTLKTGADPAMAGNVIIENCTHAYMADTVISGPLVLAFNISRMALVAEAGGSTACEVVISVEGVQFDRKASLVVTGTNTMGTGRCSVSVRLRRLNFENALLLLGDLQLRTAAFAGMQPSVATVEVLQSNFTQTGWVAAITDAASFTGLRWAAAEWLHSGARRKFAFPTATVSSPAAVVGDVELVGPTTAMTVASCNFNASWLSGSAASAMELRLAASAFGGIGGGTTLTGGAIFVESHCNASVSTNALTARQHGIVARGAFLGCATCPAPAGNSIRGLLIDGSTHVVEHGVYHADSVAADSNILVCGLLFSTDSDTHAVNTVRNRGYAGLRQLNVMANTTGKVVLGGGVTGVIGGIADHMPSAARLTEDFSRREIAGCTVAIGVLNSVDSAITIYHNFARTRIVGHSVDVIASSSLSFNQINLEVVSVSGSSCGGIYIGSSSTTAITIDSTSSWRVASVAIVIASKRQAVYPCYGIALEGSWNMEGGGSVVFDDTSTYITQGLSTPTDVTFGNAYKVIRGAPPPSTVVGRCLRIGVGTVMSETYLFDSGRFPSLSKKLYLGSLADCSNASNPFATPQSQCLASYAPVVCSAGGADTSVAWDGSQCRCVCTLNATEQRGAIGGGSFVNTDTCSLRLNRTLVDDVVRAAVNATVIRPPAAASRTRIASPTSSRGTTTTSWTTSASRSSTLSVDGAPSATRTSPTVSSTYVSVTAIPSPTMTRSSSPQATPSSTIRVVTATPSPSTTRSETVLVATATRWTGSVTTTIRGSVSRLTPTRSSTSVMSSTPTVQLVTGTQTATTTPSPTPRTTNSASLVPGISRSRSATPLATVSHRRSVSRSVSTTRGTATASQPRSASAEPSASRHRDSSSRTVSLHVLTPSSTATATQSINRASGTLTLLPPPEPPAIPIPKALEDTATTSASTAAVAGSVASPAAALQVARAVSVLAALTVCTETGQKTGPTAQLEFPKSLAPFFGLGAARGYYHRGVLLSAAGCVAGLFVGALIAGLFLPLLSESVRPVSIARRKDLLAHDAAALGRSAEAVDAAVGQPNAFQRALRLMRSPGILAIVGCLAADGVATSLVVVLADEVKNPLMDVPLVVAGFLLLLATFALVLWAVRRGPFGGFFSYMPIVVCRPSDEKVVGWGNSWLCRVLLLGDEAWMPIPPGRLTDSYPPTVFLEHYGVIFIKYRGTSVLRRPPPCGTASFPCLAQAALWFRRAGQVISAHYLAIDLALTVASSAMEGALWIDCVKGSLGMAFVNALAVVSAVAFRPYTIPTKNFLLALMSLFTCLGAFCAAAAIQLERETGTRAEGLREYAGLFASIAAIVAGVSVIQWGIRWLLLFMLFKYRLSPNVDALSRGCAFRTPRHRAAVAESDAPLLGSPGTEPARMESVLDGWDVDADGALSFVADAELELMLPAEARCGRRARRFRPRPDDMSLVELVDFAHATTSEEDDDDDSGDEGGVNGAPTTKVPVAPASNAGHELL